MVLLGGLDLVLCSESIETVSITGSYRLQDGPSSTLISQYENRAAEKNLSLDQFFEKRKNENSTNTKTTIPHYVGGRSNPIYPPTEGYARATLLIHKPWSKGNKPFDPDVDLVDQFMVFIKSPSCPKSVLIPFERMRWRYQEKLGIREAIASDIQETKPDGVDNDIIDILQIAASFNAPNEEDMLSRFNLNRGLHYQWDKPPSQVRKSIFDSKVKY